MKFVRCLSGKVWDVAIDLRKDSKTFLKWNAEILTPENNYMYIIPEGFAHGFQVLEANSELLYLHTNFYNKEAERGIRYNDPLINIDWPLTTSEISERDLTHPLLTSDYKGIR